MRECAKVGRLLSRYLDKELDNIRDFRVKRHLDSCPACRKELLELSRVKELVLKQERKALPQDYLISRLWKRIADEQHDRKRLSWLASVGGLSRRLIPVPVAAVVLSIAFLVICFRRPASEYSLEEYILSGTQATTTTALELILGAKN